MPRRVSDTFTAGMITDVIGAPGSVQELSDLYVRRGGELACRGGITSVTASATNAGFHCGWSQAQFHPNMGTMACRGAATATGYGYVASANRYQLLGAPLHTVPTATAFSFSFVTEGTNYDQVPLHAGVATAASAATGLPMERIIQMTNAGDEILMAGEIGSLYKWGGCLVGAYNTGTVAVASASGSASRIITGTGTSWATSVQEGQYILMDGVAEKGNGFQRSYRITKVVDNTHLEIELPIFATAGYSGITYRIQSVAVIQSPDGVWNQTDERPRQVGVVTYHQGRCWTAGVSDKDTAYNTVYNYDRIRWSGTLDENSNGYSHLDLWGASASIDIFPGIGGSIRGLVSMGNELVVVKSHGLFRVTGSAAWDGSGSGLGIQIISTEVGANGFNAWTLTSRGLVIAARDGLYLYDGETVSSLTDGKVKRWWESNYAGFEFVVSQYEDKVIVTPAYWTSGSGNKLVWDAEQNLFWTITSAHFEFMGAVSVYTSSDEYVGDFAFPAGLDSFSQQGHHGDTGYYSYVNMTHINHKKGWDGATPGDHTGSGPTPKPALITQPFLLAEDPVSEGRVNNVLVHAAVKAGGTESPVGESRTDVLLLSGYTYDGITNRTSVLEYYGEARNPEEYGIHAAALTSQDRVFRIPIDDMDPSPAARVLIDSDTAVNDIDNGWGMRIYAVGVDYVESEVQGP